MMKYWDTRDKGNSVVMTSEPRILSITKVADGKVYFGDQVDDFFGFYCSKEIAIDTLQEAIDWLKKEETK